MGKKAYALAASIFVLVLLVVVIALGVRFTRDTTVRNTYELSTNEPVNGLETKATVRYRGIAVGKVTSIDLDPQTRGNVRVRIAVDTRVPMTESTYATLSYQGVTGLAFIALDDSGQSTVPLKPNEDNPPRIPVKPSMLAVLQDRSERILDQVQELTVSLNALIGPDNQERIATTLDNVAQLSANTSQLTHDLSRQLTPVLTNLNALTTTAQHTLESAKTIADKATVTVDQLNNTVGVLNSATLPSLARLTNDAGRLARNFNRFAKRLEDNPQSLVFGNGENPPGPGEPGFTFTDPDEQSEKDIQK
ncbi:MAG: MlaD family protein [Burkholderiaceae bacterium]|jgi:phospholipid/cholesterol/gamma-HCH transport system substrate-binding protein|nr:MlaD family protein [Burkholderiaceae bacterium]